MTESSIARLLETVRQEPNLLEHLGSSSSATIRKDLKELSHDVLSQVCVSVSVPTKTGGAVTLLVAPPQRVMQLFIERSPAFKELLSVKYTVGQTWRLVLYHDEVTPGNALRPDNRRKFTILYGTFIEFGANLLRDERIWLPLAVIRHDLGGASAGGLSGALLCIFRCFFEGLQAGYVLKLISPTVFVYRVGNLLADEDAIRASWACKGASGVRPCFACMNVVMKGYAKHNQVLVDLDEEDPSKFQLMSDQDWFQMADHLKQQAAVLNKKALDTLEKSMGLNYVPGGLMFDAEIRTIVRPTSTTFDSMHVWFSNGICNTELHVFLEAAETKCGLTYSVIHAYMQSASWQPPSCHADMDVARIFNESRRKANKDNFKGMASEVLALLPLLRHLVSTALADRIELDKEKKSFEAMCKCVDLLSQLKLGATRDTDALLAATQQFMQLHKLAYGSDHVRPKHHYAFHLPGQIQRDGCLLDAFVLERKHRVAKRIATACDNTRSFEASVLSRILNEAIEAMPASFLVNSLVGPRAMCADTAKIVGEVQCTICKSALCNGVTVSVGDVLLAMDMALKIVLFFSGVDGLVACIVQPHDYFGSLGSATKWKSCGNSAIFDFSSSFTLARYWSMDGDVLLTL